MSAEGAAGGAGDATLNPVDSENVCDKVDNCASGENLKKPSAIPGLSKIARAYPAGPLQKVSATNVQEENEEENTTPTLRKHNSVLTEDTDSFIIGDRIWVSGTKPGQIAYIGETQFAPGEWAGIVLDKPIGKNDGSVSGTRYFQCPAKRGVFARLTRLTRTPLPGADLLDGDVSPPHSIRSHSATPPPTSYNGARRRPSPISPPGSTVGLRKSPSISNSNTSLASSHVVDFRIDDRVIIKSTQGSKVGVLRFMGTTDFAHGEWCGVELDDPKGKNDGSVEGKRYFECRPNFGLFAPVHKVSKSPLKYRPGTENCAIHSGPGLPPSGIRRAGSRESMNSMSSSMLSGATPSARRVRLGVNSLSSQKPPTKSSTTTTTFHTRTQTLQDVLREKQLHIEQLLKERDFERAEITKAANQADEAEQKFANLRAEFEQYRSECESKLKEYTSLISQFNKEREELISQLDDEKRKYEDLQFNFEEAAITKGDIEVANETMLGKIKNLEEQLNLERQKTETSEAISTQLFEAEEALTKSRDEIDALKSQLQQRGDQSSSEEQIVQLQKRLQDAQNESEIVQVKNQQLSANFERTITEEKSSHEQIQLKLSNELNEFKTKYQAISIAAQTQNNQVNELNSELIHVKALMDEKDIAMRNHQIKLTDIENNLNKEIDRVKMELSAKINDVETLIEGNNKKDHEIDSLNSQLDAIKSQLQIKVGELEKYQTETGEMDQSLKHQIEQLNQTLNAQLADKEQMEQRFQSLIEEKETSLTNANESIARQTELLEKLHKEISDVKLEDERLKHDLSETATKQTQDKDEMEKMCNEIERKNEELTKFVIIIKNIEDQLADKNAEVDSKNSEIHSLHQQIDDEKKAKEKGLEEINSLKLSLGDTQRKIEFYEEKLTESAQQRQHVENEIKNLMGSSGDFSVKLGQMTAELKQRDEQFEHLKNELNEKLQQSERTVQELQLSLEKSRDDAEKTKYDYEEKMKKLSETENAQKIQNQNALSETNKIRDELLEKNTHLENQISRRDVELKAKSEENQEICNTVSQQRETIAELRKATETYEKQIEEFLKKQAAGNQNDISKNAEAVAEADRKIAQLNDSLRQREADLLEKHSEEVKRLTEDATKKTEELGASFEKTLTEKNLELKQRDEIVAKLTSDLEDLHKTLSILKVQQKQMEENDIEAASKLEEIGQLTTEFAQLKHAYALQSSVKIESDEKILQLQTAVGTLQKDLNIVQQEKMELAAATTNSNSVMDILKNDLNHTVQKLQNVESTVEEFQLQNAAYKELLQSLQFSDTQKSNLIKNLENLAKKTEQSDVYAGLFNVAKHIRVGPVEQETKRVIELQNSLKETQKKLGETEGLLRDHQNDVSSLQDELLKVQQRLKEAQGTETGKSHTQNNNDVDYKNHQQLLEEKKLMEGQVEFLNSIIVDMQRKNKEQQVKIDILESGFSPAAVDELKLFQPGEARVAPRMYCDICEEFDLHETEDCPQQTSEDVPVPTESKKKRPPPRPYCEICEVFGHNTEDCQDDQTF